ncbi:SpaA isopeptide-forming pilin-related protein [Actinomyces bovis]|nr:SpaA isopeptide-forming pilin-related protein [Actinomyces bovis]
MSDSGESDFNGLAIGSDGAEAWALNRADSETHTRIGIYKWDAASGTTKIVHYGSLPSGKYGTAKINNLVAGGINPKGPDAKYYFGGFIDDGYGTYFATYRYDGGRIILVGYVKVLDVSSNKGNGDLVFSASGDMFVLWNDGDGKTLVVPVRREDLASSAGDLIPHGNIRTLKTGEGRYNGLAFDSDGRLFIQYGKDSKTKNYSIDPDDGATLSDKVSIGISNGTDLASCASPPTLYVEKNVVGREKPGDQFKISVEGKNRGVLASESTSGSGTGTQASVGVFILYKPRTYTIKETAAGGARLSDYNTTLTCIDEVTRENLAVSRVSDTEYTFTQKDGSNHDAICTLRNEPKPKTGSVTWNKVDAGGRALTGSAWQIIPDAAGQATIYVTDNSGRDKDPDVAEFRVDDLPLGGYTLHESTVPEGYVGASDKHFTITSAHATAPNSLGSITNTPIKGVITWTKTKPDGSALGGSTWSLTPTNPVGAVRQITDCTAAPCVPANGDRDQRPGYFRLGDMTYGTYKLTEASAPTGYVKSTETKTVKVTTNGATVDAGAVVNQPIAGSATWSKTGMDHRPLGGSVWELVPGPGGAAKLEVTDCVESAPARCTGADKDPAEGGFRVTGLDWGRYLLHEKTPPPGYAAGADRPFEVNAGNASVPVVLGEQVNKRLPRLSWTKTDAAGMPAGGSVWTLTGPAGAASAAVKVEDCVQASADMCPGPDRDHTAGGFLLQDLALGDYTLTEDTAPTGLVADQTPHPLKLKDTDLEGTVQAGSFKNEPIKGTVTWTKVNAGRRPLGESTWTLTPTNPAGPARTITDCVLAPCATATGDRDERPGYFRLEGVVYGTYTLVEDQAPKGYVKSADTKTVQVSTNGQVVAVGEVVNQALPQVAWTKTKPDGTALGGSTWSWKPTSPAGEAVEVGDCEASSADQCKGADKDPAAGAFLLKGVTPGEYVLTETGQPEGYVLDATPHAVTVAGTDIGKTVTAGAFVNQEAKGSVTWSKVDADNGEALGGSAWNLTGPGAGAAAQVVEDCVADDAAACTGLDKDPVAGGFKVEELGLGEYKLVEKVAPAGYRLDSKTEHPFSVTAKAPAYAFDKPFENTKTAVPVLPLTGGMGADTFLMGGGAFGGLALVGAFLRRRRSA